MIVKDVMIEFKVNWKLGSLALYDLIKLSCLNYVRKVTMMGLDHKKELFIYYIIQLN